MMRDKGKIKADKELEQEKKQRYKDFMHRLQINFSRWIQKRLNEESYEHKALESHIKDVMSKNEKAKKEALDLL